MDHSIGNFVPFSFNFVFLLFIFFYLFILLFDLFCFTVHEHLGLKQ